MMETASKCDDETTVDQRFYKMRSKYVEVYGHPWFFRMTGDTKDTGLVGYYGQDELTRGVVIARDVKGMVDNYKQFAWFQSRDEFVYHHNKYPADERHFYEVIGATVPYQRPYFDIDIDATQLSVDEDDGVFSFAYDALKGIIDAIKRTLSDMCGIDGPVSFQVFETLHPMDVELGIPKKFSFHVIVKGFYFSSYEDMKTFGHLVKTDYELDCDYESLIDEIWGRTRQFRLMGSSKLGSMYTKSPIRVTGVSDEPVDLNVSFVTNIDGCEELKLLPTTNENFAVGDVIKMHRDIHEANRYTVEDIRGRVARLRLINPSERVMFEDVCYIVKSKKTKEQVIEAWRKRHGYSGI